MIVFQIIKNFFRNTNTNTNTNTNPPTPPRTIASGSAPTAKKAVKSKSKTKSKHNTESGYQPSSTRDDTFTPSSYPDFQAHIVAPIIPMVRAAIRARQTAMVDMTAAVLVAGATAVAGKEI